MIPQVISAGFKRTDAIDYGIQDQENSMTPDTFNNQDAPTFLPEQEHLFQKRFEEKYYLPDPVYLQWLRINHPTAQEKQTNEAADSAHITQGKQPPNTVSSPTFCQNKSSSFR